MANWLEYLGLALIASGLSLKGLTAMDPAYWCLIVGICLYVKFGGWKI